MKQQELSKAEKQLLIDMYSGRYINWDILWNTDGTVHTKGLSFKDVDLDKLWELGLFRVALVDGTWNSWFLSAAGEKLATRIMIGTGNE